MRSRKTNERITLCFKNCNYDGFFIWQRYSLSFSKKSTNFYSQFYQELFSLKSHYCLILALAAIFPLPLPFISQASSKKNKERLDLQVKKSRITSLFPIQIQHLVIGISFLKKRTSLRRSTKTWQNRDIAPVVYISAHLCSLLRLSQKIRKIGPVTDSFFPPWRNYTFPSINLPCFDKTFSTFAQFFAISRVICQLNLIVM